ncbi:MAG: alpha/beta hydrolase [Clostridiales bacterium]|nr:alpha/beta hydrolase [Clostridiales bacterium]
MDFYWILLIIFASILLLFFLITFACFYIVFYSAKRKNVDKEEFSLPPGKIYIPFKEEMFAWMKEVRETPSTPMEITSFDGLTLRGKYYECNKEGVVELMFHGYRGNAERDLCGGVQRCFSLGRNTLIVDQRASNLSDGHVITFGIRESKDCLCWINHLIKELGDDVKILLTGISMGASTVLMASKEDLPKNVIGIIADCGYSSPKAIIQKIIKNLRLPINLTYFFIKLGARIFGRFNLEEDSPIESVKKAKVPIMFIHGKTDDFVPYEMSVQNYESCTSLKKLYLVDGAGHGLAYPINKEEYLKQLKDFELLCKNN